MHLILDQYGLFIERDDYRFKISDKETVRFISPGKVASIQVYRNCTITSSAILLAADHKIPLLFFDGSSHVKARIWQSDFGSTAEIRIGQLKFVQEPEGILFLFQLMLNKLEGQIENLKYLRDRRMKFKEEIDNSIGMMKENFKLMTDKTEPLPMLDFILGMEGTIAKIYWEILAKCLADLELFDGRSRRPAKDRFNALLNYLYGMLYPKVETAALAAGLDPALGILHTEGYNRPALVFDLIEPFRPWADRFAIESVIKKQLEDKFFEPKEEGIWLSAEGRKFTITAFNAVMHERTLFNKRKIKRTDQIQFLCSQLAQNILAHRQVKD